MLAGAGEIFDDFRQPVSFRKRSKTSAGPKQYSAAGENDGFGLVLDLFVPFCQNERDEGSAIERTPPPGRNPCGARAAVEEGRQEPGRRQQGLPLSWRRQGSGQGGGDAKLDGVFVIGQTPISRRSKRCCRRGGDGLHRLPPRWLLRTLMTWPPASGGSVPWFAR